MMKKGKWKIISAAIIAAIILPTLSGCNKKNINKGCYAWLILQKSAIIRQKTTDEEVLYEKS